MKLDELFVLEAPLPDDWDATIFNPKVPFKRRIEYAKERSKRIGAGSSRIVFEIPYEGRMTVLKVSKNAKGVFQSEVESEVMDDHYLSQSNIFVPKIDNDPNFTWLHCEKAEKIKPTFFNKWFGIKDMYEFKQLLEYSSGGHIINDYRRRNVNDVMKEYGKKFENHLENQDVADKLYRIVEMMDAYDMPIGDICRLSSWGIWKNEPVLIDLGLNNTVYTSHYSR